MAEYKKCPFCGGEVYKISEMVWETGKDDLLEHPLHALPGIGLPCPLSGLKFRALKWQQRPGDPVSEVWMERTHLRVKNKRIPSKMKGKQI